MHSAQTAGGACNSVAPVLIIKSKDLIPVGLGFLREVRSALLKSQRSSVLQSDFPKRWRFESETDSFNMELCFFGKMISPHLKSGLFLYGLMFYRPQAR